MTVIPETVTPDDLARSMGWSARRVRKLARENGACRILGNKMVLTKNDVEQIMEAARPCPSKSTSEAKSGTTGAALPVGGYADLQARLTKLQRKESQPSAKRKRGKVISMDQRPS